MESALWQTTATAEAEALLRDMGITALPVCPFSIARDLGIEVRALGPNSQPGVSGMLLRHGNVFGILYAQYLDNEGFERFCVAHELGHYRLPGHPESVLIDGVHTSHAGFSSNERHELEADHFAAGLLLPSFLFDPLLNDAGTGLAAIETLKGKCGTSLTATAIRYAQRTPEATAIVVSVGSAVEYCFMSESLRSTRGLDWLRKRSPLPQSSVTREFNKVAANVARGERAEGASPFQDWFGGALKANLYEEVVGLGRYGKTLTILAVSDLPTPEEIEEEQDLAETWTPKFR